MSSHTTKETQISSPVSSPPPPPPPTKRTNRTVESAADGSPSDVTPSDRHRPLFRISDGDTSRVLLKMVRLGYFHTSHNHGTHLGGGIDTDPNQERKVEEEEEEEEEEATNDHQSKSQQMKTFQQRHRERPQYDPSDESCTLVLSTTVTTSGDAPSITTTAPTPSTTTSSTTPTPTPPTFCCVTRQHLASQVLRSLHTFGGRQSIRDLAAYLTVTIPDVDRAVQNLLRLPQPPPPPPLSSITPTSTSPILRQVRNELLSCEYLDRLCQNDVTNVLEATGGAVPVSDLANDVFGLPFEDTLQVLRDRVVVGTVVDASTEPENDDEDDDDDTAPGGDRNQQEGTNNGHDDGMNLGRVFSNGVRLVRGNKGGKLLLTTAEYRSNKRKELLDALSRLDTPTLFDDIAGTINYDPSLLLQHTLRLCNSQQLRGELCMDHNNTTCTVGIGIKGIDSQHTTARYVPHGYTERQTEALRTFLVSNGYVGRKQCLEFGVSKSRMVECLTESFPNTVRIGDSFVLPDVLTPPIRAAIEDCIASESFVDLSTFLHEELIESSSNNNDNDLRLFLDGILNEVYTLRNEGKVDENDTDDRDGDCLVLSCGEVLYFSGVLVRSIRTHLLPGLVDQHAGGVAERIATAEPTNHQPLVICGRKRTNKKKSLSVDGSDERSLQPSSVSSSVLLPLTVVVRAIAEEYPDLRVIQESHRPIATVDHNGDGSGDEDDDDESGLLYQLCRDALYTVEFEKLCIGAVKKAVDARTKTKKGGSSSVEGGVARARIESAFEDKTCFPTACRLVQMMAKFPRSLEGVRGSNDSDDVNVDVERKAIAERDFLNGCGADFAKRITEYSLFQHGVEDGTFFFDSGSDDGAAPDEDHRFYTSVDMTRRSFPRVYFRHSTAASAIDGGEGEGRDILDPLAALRNLLPGNVGVSLARMWILTGGENYEGGTKRTEVGTDLVRPGNFAKFLDHVEESCLMMCGIPFKVLDKKSEKNLLFTRRKELTRQLVEATDAIDVLEYTIMLLIQQCRGMVVCRPALTGLCLSMLAEERKVPVEVTEKLRKVASVSSRGDVPDDLLRTIRSIGLSRDIAKDYSTIINH